MTKPLIHPLAMDGKDPSILRGDPIERERYFSREFAKREWDQMWTKIWHIAGRVNQLQEPGDYVTHNFMRESVVIALQDDGSMRGFYNACGHRGQRLTWELEGSQDAFACPYHGWVWRKDGSLAEVQDPDDFPQGDPCGKLTLKEVRVDTWAGFIWYTMNPDAPPLLKYLEPMPELYKNYKWDERMVRVRWVRVALDSNWKFFSDNFNESYHTRTAHPQVPPLIDQDHFTSRYEMYQMGHARIIQLGRPSTRDLMPKNMPHPFDDRLREWDIDPAAYPDFETKVVQGWLDLKAAKKRLWKERGLYQYEHLTDEELTESPFTFLFPNVAIGGGGGESFGMHRWEPHPTDPEKCFYDMWTMAYPVGSEYRQRGIHQTLQIKEAPFEFLTYDGGRGQLNIAEQVTYQDMGLTMGQQAGWNSRGYQEPYLAAQETRVRRFHEVLNDYLAGNPAKPRSENVTLTNARAGEAVLKSVTKSAGVP